jgi:simple sugar transport system permease protein
MTEQIHERSFLNKVLRFKELGIIVALIAVYATFALDKPQYFPTQENAVNIIFFGGPLAFVSLGVAMVLVVAEVDLSVGGTFVLTGCFLGLLVTDHYANVWEALILTLALGALLGFINGMAAVKTGIPSLIITLGTLLIYTSIAYIITSGFSIVFNQPLAFKKAFGGFLIGSATHEPALPTMLVWMVAAVIIFYVILNHTRFGNWQIAVGDRPWAALTSGIPVARVKVASFMLCSLLATFASVLTLSQLNGISATEGTLLPFQGIGAAVIGGTSLFGGSAAILGAILGAELIGMIQDGISVIGVNVYYYEAAIGVVIIIAAVLNIFFKTRGEAA